MSALHSFDVAPYSETHNHVYNFKIMQAEQAQQPPSYQHEFALRLGRVLSPGADGPVPTWPRQHSTVVESLFIDLRLKAEPMQSGSGGQTTHARSDDGNAQFAVQRSDGRLIRLLVGKPCMPLEAKA